MRAVGQEEMVGKVVTMEESMEGPKVKDARGVTREEMVEGEVEVVVMEGPDCLNPRTSTS